MRNKFALLLFIFIFGFLMSCEKANKPYSKIESVAAVDGGDVQFNCFYFYSRLDKVSYGVCWSDTGSIPVRNSNYGPYQISNFADGFLNKKGGEIVMSLRELPRGKPLLARSYIKFDGGSTIYSKETLPFETDLFYNMGCTLNENELIIKNERHPIISMISGTNNNGQYEVTAELSDYTMTFLFAEKPDEEAIFEFVNKDVYYPWYDEVKLVIYDKNNDCVYSQDDYYKIMYVNLDDSNNIYFKFCNVPFNKSCDPTLPEISAFLKIES